MAFWFHYEVIKRKPFPRYWPFVRGIHRSPVNSPHKGQWRGALMFSLICAWKKLLSIQSWGWWLGTPSHPLWRHWNVRMRELQWMKNTNVCHIRAWAFFNESIYLFSIHCVLIDWGWYKKVVSLQTTISNSFSCLKIAVFWYKFHWSLFLVSPVDIIGTDNGFAPKRRQTIIRTNNSIVSCHIYLSFDINKLNYVILCILMINQYQFRY